MSSVHGESTYRRMTSEKNYLSMLTVVCSSEKDKM
jgi:hypothetical protein